MRRACGGGMCLGLRGRRRSRLEMLRRRIRLQKQGSMTTVVWNPWSDGAAALADLGDDEWRQMACVEASNILGNAITLAPGAQHTMTAILSVIPE